MADLKICRICLRTESKVYNYDQYQLKSYYEEVLALKVNEFDNLPHYFCFECAMQLHKFHKFKEKSYCGQKILRDMLRKGPITYESIYKINRADLNLESPLRRVTFTIIKPFTTNNIKEELKNDNRIENVKFVNEDYFIEDVDDIIDPKTETSPNIKNVKCEPRLANISLEIVDDSYSVEDHYDVEPVDTVIENDVHTDIQTDIIGKAKDFKTKDKFKRINLMDRNNWKRIDLTEEQAVQEHRAKADDEKYKSAAFKCSDCFKGFSKEEMLKRHNKLRHGESIGQFECRFCRTRFRWKCDLRKHLRAHYTRYLCLRCRLVCPVENTAILHEQYHSGVVRKCEYCNEEFRHSSTYYTHLRTHRSEYVCTLCGSSFVSEAGLHQHKRIKHCTNDIESPDDDEDVNTFCSRCDIRFETRKAYEEHLFHSALHAEVVVEGIQIDNQPRKILGKKMQDKITSLLKSRKFEKVPIKPEIRRNKKIRRKKTKPTTCHQCGKHFDTQAACLKHHLAEHPGTSFCPPNERHICEICGASLAPGSVAVHQNLHTREKVHACDTCGRQFLSNIGLKRHMLTHTGEKPFACSLCDKRFTQSNSMKLHYRTFHLKQPYPKRNRRKKIEDKKLTSEECSDGSNTPKKVLEQKTEAVVSEQVNAESIVIAQNEIDYLTLGYQKY
ncbi:zinc finger protein 432-like [Melitaea cinxia]|uniref:zinc finger protein 432-like n=1 Tax=Melitaea cinxia TaxID=113334 RepID=UPI001E271A05|nr:zinc finger protein 432-like [Melitaea cinxia]